MNNMKTEWTDMVEEMEQLRMANNDLLNICEHAVVTLRSNEIEPQ